MNLRLYRKHLAILLAVLLSVTTLTGCPSDKSPANDNRTIAEKKADQRKAIVRGVATAFDIAATALESGITTVRGFRKSREVSPADALKMASLGRRGNSVALKSAQTILSIDEIGGGDLVTLVESLLASAQDLNAEGVLVIKGRQQLIFTGITTGTLIYLRAQGDELRKLVGENPDLKLALDADSRRKLERAVKTMVRNEKELDASVEELQKLSRDAT